MRARFATTDTQFKAKLALERDLNRDPTDPDYIVTVNLAKNTPVWMQKLGAQADVPGPGPARRRALPAAGRHAKARPRIPIKACRPTARALLRDKNMRHAGIDRVGNRHRDPLPRQPTARAKARSVLANQQPELQLDRRCRRHRPEADRAPSSRKRCSARWTSALKQNITTLHNRVNELGVAEPVIQQQGADRIVVELPGVQDTAKAKDIIGRTATLEVRLVDDPVNTGHRTRPPRFRSATNCSRQGRRPGAGVEGR